MISMLDEENKIRRQITRLKTEHDDLETRLCSPEVTSGCMLDMQRLKRRKLKLKDEISYLRSSLEEDIIA